MFGRAEPAANKWGKTEKNRQKHTHTHKEFYQIVWQNVFTAYSDQLNEKHLDLLQ